MMHIHTHTFSPYTFSLSKCYLKKKSTAKTLDFATKNVSPFNGVVKTELWYGQMKKSTRAAIFAVSEGQNWKTDNNKPKKRKIVEHITLIKAKEGLSDEDEKDMLDYLYTSQYQMAGIVSISLGRISDDSVENFTHAVYIRFQEKGNLTKFYENPFYLGVINDHVMPYCHGIINADYESQVEDDILAIFRKGEEFSYGVEFVLLMAFAQSSLGGSAEDALASLAKLMTEFPSLIVQATQGSNINVGSKEFTHVVVVRFRSSEAFKLFMGSSEYKKVWRSKFQPVMQKVISISFSVDPVGTEVM